MFDWTKDDEEEAGMFTWPKDQTEKICESLAPHEAHDITITRNVTGDLVVRCKRCEADLLIVKKDEKEAN